jgi:hypothetical protein
MPEKPSGRVIIGRREEAKYKPVIEPTHRHNLYIEALPEIMTLEKVSSRIARRPVWFPEERQNRPIDRLQAVQRIENYIEPLPIHIDLEQRFSRMIRNGYLNRNPINEEWIKQIRSGFKNLDWGGGKILQLFNQALLDLLLLGQVV